MSHAITPATSLETAPRGEVTPGEWERVRRYALIAAGGGATAFVLFGLLHWLLHRDEGAKQLFVSYLVGYNYWLGCGLGGLVFLMLQYVTGGAWGLLLRRILEASASTILPLAVLFIPILAGLPIVYEEFGHWTPVHPHDSKLQFKAVWLSAPAITIKAIVFFACWIGLAYLFRRWSQQQDEGANGQLLERCESLGAPGIVVYAATITFASIDWVMALQPDWYSTIYPVMFAVGQLLNGYAFALTVFLLLSDRPPFAGSIHASHMRDFGSLLLAFVMFWAYMSFSQLLLVWVANLPEETPWYLLRARGGWQYVAIFIALFHFAVPFILLLLRDIKEYRRRLLAVAAGLLVMRFIDLFWWIEPSLKHEGEYFFWLMDIAAWLAVGGLYVWWFTGQLRSRSLLPMKDPNLAEALRDE
ncbi:MAG TPA: hypothetical protein VMG10_25545 [Gemmataceae bacterium]|nr:hypothetical protein [Gemmataceae bacterium]